MHTSSEARRPSQFPPSTPRGSSRPVTDRQHISMEEPGAAKADGPIEQGPFSDEEFALIKEAFQRCRARGAAEGRASRESLERIFSLSSEPGFARDLIRAMASVGGERATNGAQRKLLSFGQFFNGVCGCTRASERSITRTFLRVLDREARGALPATQVAELFRLGHTLAHACSAGPQAPPPPPTDPSGGPPAVPPLPPPSSASSTSSSSSSSFFGWLSTMRSGSREDGEGGGAFKGGAGWEGPCPPPPPPFRTALFEKAFRRRKGQDHGAMLEGRPVRCATVVADAEMLKVLQLAKELSLEELQRAELDLVPLDELHAWLVEAVPLLHCTLGAFVFQRLCCGAAEPPPALRFALPHVLEEAGASEVLQPDIMFGLATATAACQGPWQRVYSSRDHGCSFGQLCLQVVDYEGPTVTLIRDRAGAVFGLFTSYPWRDGGEDYYGSFDCFCFRLEPDFAVFRPKFDSDENFMYLNATGRGFAPKGMGWGGADTHSFRVLVGEGMGMCTARPSCTTFESGELAATKTFDLDVLEVWAVGGQEVIEKAMAAHDKTREVKQENMAKAGKVDKRLFLDNDFDREHLLGRTFSAGRAAR